MIINYSIFLAFLDRYGGQICLHFMLYFYNAKFCFSKYDIIFLYIKHSFNFKVMKHKNSKIPIQVLQAYHPLFVPTARHEGGKVHPSGRGPAECVACEPLHNPKYKRVK